MTYEELENALKVLDITIPMSYRKIQIRYKELIKQFHPDVSSLPPEQAKEKTAEINRAYEIIKQYCQEYRLDFSREEFIRQRPEEGIKQILTKDPIWGKNA